MIKGDWFRVAARPGQVYAYMHTAKNGDIVAFGGDKKPTARRQWEAFRPDTNFIPAKAPFTKRVEEI